jgi:D-alanyl-D-alanine carboxypeptidase/D-alanyl-D-alanine-endopeptidase (penicillin-binding protein 4)
MMRRRHVTEDKFMRTAPTSHQSPPPRLFHRASRAAAVALLLATAAARASSLADRINATLGHPSLKTASVSISVVELTPAGPQILYTHNPTLPLAPASNTKLLTTAAAFERYGPKAAFKTLLYKNGDDLILVGGGDPALGDPKLAAAKGQTCTTVFDAWADALIKAGITHAANLIVDDSLFDTQFIQPDWPKDQLLTWYSAPIGALNFNDNCLDWTPTVGSDGIGVSLSPDTSYVHVSINAKRGTEQAVWLWRPDDSNAFQMRGTVRASATVPESVTIFDPGLYTGAVLRDVLTRHGITFSGSVQRGRIADAANPQLVASHATPLLDAIGRANTNSINMMAECICKRLGHDATKQPGSWQNGTAAVMQFVTGLGVPADQVTLDDGSGLSKINRVSAAAFTTVLAHIAARPDGQLFVNTLAQPGKDGTLEKNRFKGMPCFTHVHAKTGHINGVSTLSGYVDVGNRRFVYSLLVNHHQGNANPWQDEVVNEIYKWASE